MSDLLDSIETAMADALCKACGHKYKEHYPEMGCVRGFPGWPRTASGKACQCRVFESQIEDVGVVV